MNESTEPLENRFNELLKDKFVISSPILNPLKVCPSLNELNTLEPSSVDCPTFD